MQPQELASLLKTQLQGPMCAQTDASPYPRVQVVDVRDDDFRQGGHITGAINIPSSRWGEPDIQESLYQNLTRELRAEVVVFHCMKSQVRGPSAAKNFFRWLMFKKDAAPLEVCVLAGGFEGWHREYKHESHLIEDLCDLADY